MKKMVIVIVLIAASVLWAAPARGQGAQNFVGIWAVDYERTMEEAKKSPKYNAKEAAAMGEMMKRLMATMKVEFTTREMIYHRGGKTNAIPYTVKSNDGSKTILSCKAPRRDFEVVVTIREGGLMNFKSSGSDDMDYYIWKRGK
ncbi:MAG: hypothetical protein RDV48_29390 [Candidatus Eremiobacteraeota bacterium]|nr:hypothetical protein [Candidatus Eremiobacteraeota bacterium]